MWKNSEKSWKHFYSLYISQLVKNIKNIDYWNKCEPIETWFGTTKVGLIWWTYETHSNGTCIIELFVKHLEPFLVWYQKKCNTLNPFKPNVKHARQIETQEGLCGSLVKHIPVAHELLNYLCNKWNQDLTLILKMKHPQSISN
jgi:hypothetical protein